MKSIKNIYCFHVFTLIAFFSFLPDVYSHCDTMSGPVATDAQKALETKDFKTIQIWVGAAQEKELEKRFNECIAVRNINEQTKKLADMYFIETSIRLHREAEGMPFTGVKPAQPLPVDEKALETGEIKTITDLLTEAIRSETQKWFEKAVDARKHKDDNVESGRKWVDAYVKYVVYIHGLYMQIEAGPQHGVED